MTHTLRHRLTAVLIIIAAILPSRAQDGGGAAYSFLNVTSSAKIYGLGGLNISLVDDDVFTADQNPALLGQEMSGMLGLDYMHYIGGSNFAGLRYAHSAGERGAWAARMRYFGYGSMRETLPDGTVVGDFSPRDVVASATYSHDISDRVRGGASLNFLYSSYAEYTAIAAGVDLGVNYYDPEHDLSLSAVIANLGGQLKRFDTAYNRLPFDVRLGWSQSFGSFPIRFSVTAWNLTKWHLPYSEYGGFSGDEVKNTDKFLPNLFRHLIFGADLVASPTYYISLGYNYKMRTDMSTYNRSFISGFSLGAGIKVKKFGVHIALAQPHTGATTMMLNLTYNFNSLIY